MIAMPTARVQANTSAPTPGAVTQIASASESSSVRKSAFKSAPRTVAKSSVLGNSPKSRASRAKAAAKADKLPVTKTQQADQECWTVKTGKRGEKKDDFRIRLADSGFRVVLRFHDENDARRERYCCYLSAKEWRDVRRKSLAAFVQIVAAKVEARRSAGDLDAHRYQEIVPRLNALI